MRKPPSANTMLIAGIFFGVSLIVMGVLFTSGRTEGVPVLLWFLGGAGALIILSVIAGYPSAKKQESRWQTLNKMIDEYEQKNREI